MLSALRRSGEDALSPARSCTRRRDQRHHDHPHRQAGHPRPGLKNRSPHDGRAVEVRLRPDGVARVDAAMERLLEAERELLGPLAAAEQAELAGMPAPAAHLRVRRPPEAEAGARRPVSVRSRAAPAPCRPRSPSPRRTPPAWLICSAPSPSTSRCPIACCSTTSPSASTRVIGSGWSAATATASRRSCGCSPAPRNPTRAASPCAAGCGSGCSPSRTRPPPARACATAWWETGPSTNGPPTLGSATCSRLLGGIDPTRRSRASRRQLRRVHLAELLVGDWDVLLLDEPTNHLDVEGIAWLAEHLRRLEREGRRARGHHPRPLVPRRGVHPDVGGARRDRRALRGRLRRLRPAAVERDRQAAAIESKRQNLMRKELAWLRRGPRRGPRSRSSASTRRTSSSPASRSCATRSR